jgi:hypothetical protein
MNPEKRVFLVFMRLCGDFGYHEEALFGVFASHMANATFSCIM